MILKCIWLFIWHSMYNFTDGEELHSDYLVNYYSTIIIFISLCLYLESGKLVISGIDYNQCCCRPNDAVRFDVSIRKLIKLETNEVFGFCFAPSGLLSLVKFSMFQFNSMNISIIWINIRIKDHRFILHLFICIPYLYTYILLELCHYIYILCVWCYSSVRHYNKLNRHYRDPIDCILEPDN